MRFWMMGSSKDLQYSLADARFSMFKNRFIGYYKYAMASVSLIPPKIITYFDC